MDGQKIGREDKNLKVNSRRFAGIAVTGATLAALFLVLGVRPTPPPSDPAPRRGGQIVASVRDASRSFNPLVARGETGELLARLTHAPLVRHNRATSELEPWLAESWQSDESGRVHTFWLRPDVTWSDGVPLTSADVVFTVDAVFAGGTDSPLATRLTVGHQPIRAAAPDSRTVVITFAAPFGPGLRLLDELPIVPKHKLESALAAGTFASAWDLATAPADIVGAGPFVVSGDRRSDRVVLDRNPRYWRRGADRAPLPYLDRIVLQVAPGQSPDLALLRSGAIDLPSGELRLEEYAALSSAEEEGRLEVIELGVSTEPDAFWFCLKAEVKGSDPRLAFVQRREFRQAISHAVDREAFADAVFLSAAVPIWGPVTPGSADWFWPDVVRYPPDASRARALLASAGLEDRNGDGVVEDVRGTDARFTVLTERGVPSYERGLAVLRESLLRIGVVVDVAAVSSEEIALRIRDCDYDAVYHRSPATGVDPAADLSFWLSSGSAHVWNPGQRTPATEWERRIDTLILEQGATTDLERRRQQFILVQRIFAEELPVLYFAAPRLHYAHSARVRGVVPSVRRPYVLWNADMLHVLP